MVGLLLIFGVVLTASVQQPITPCKLGLDQVPEIRGLKLGQPYTKLSEILPKRYDDYDARVDETGVRREIIASFHVRDPELLKGIMHLQLSYMDEKLTSIDVTYDFSVEWQSDLHFTSAIAAQLKLPAEGWRGSYPSRLTCDGFKVETHGKRRLVIERGDFDSEVAKRRAAAEQKKRVEFKP